MNYSLRRQVPSEKIDEVHENCFLDMSLGVSLFGIIRACSDRTGEVHGAIGLNHMPEFMPDGIKARGHSVDARGQFIEPPVQELWTIVPAVES